MRPLWSVIVPETMTGTRSPSSSKSTSGRPRPRRRPPHRGPGDQPVHQAQVGGLDDVQHLVDAPDELAVLETERAHDRAVGPVHGGALGERPQLLGQGDVRGEALALELTEATIVADPERVAIVAERLRELGVQLAIDDFGTGYSSLGYLARLPANSLKIDYSFIIAMLADPNAMTLGTTLVIFVLGAAFEEARIT